MPHCVVHIYQQAVLHTAVHYSGTVTLDPALTNSQSGAIKLICVARGREGGKKINCLTWHVTKSRAICYSSNKQILQIKLLHTDNDDKDDDDDNNNNNHHHHHKGSRSMGEVAPLYEVDSTLVLTNPDVQQCNLRHKPSTSLHIRPSVRSE
jgi:hypothetical protein